MTNRELYKPEGEKLYTTEDTSIKFFQSKQIKFNKDATVNDIINVLNDIEIWVHDEEVYKKLKQLKGITIIADEGEL